MRLVVDLHSKENRSYPVIIESGVLDKIPHIMAAAKWGTRVAVITDRRVLAICGKSLRKEFSDAGLQADFFVIPPGELEKNIVRVEKLAEKMVASGLKRDCVVLGLGGGVVLDLAGFLASIYMRGVAYVAAPTTLLAMVDASIGGKTGVDLKNGKNLLGTFYQPKGVYIDPAILKTLPEKELLNGLAEVVKHGVIGDSGLFRFLEKKREKIMARDKKTLEKLIARSCKVKVRVVERDEREGKLRTLLNYGHTVGHALEKISGYSMPHGEAVAAGMAIENDYFVAHGQMPQKNADRIKKLLEKYNLPSGMPQNIKAPYMRGAMSADKKIKGGKLQMALPVKIGKARVIEIDDAGALVQ